MKILVTGSAGFIGYHLVKKLLENKSFNSLKILSIDNFDNYYDKKLKFARILDLKKIKLNSKVLHKFIKLDLKNKNLLKKQFSKFKPDVVIHLAAQAGVRLSLLNPKKYLQDNILVFLNILEICKENNVKKIVYASSSSVYGSIKKFPFTEDMNVNKPKQFYAVTKLTNELMAQAYSQLYKMQIVGIRFFTLYGPFGRPDMAIYKFTERIIKRKKIEVYNNGNHYRDFTFIDDAIEGIINITKFLINNKINKYCKIVNFGNSKPIKLTLLISKIEKILNLKAKVIYKPIQKGDVFKTFANIKNAKKYFNYRNKTSINVGLKVFINWYRNYHKC